MQTTYEEIMNMFRETAAISRKNTEKSRETDAQIKEILQELLQSQKKTDEKFRETAQQFSETDRKIKELNTLFTSQWGKLIESLVAGDLVNLLNQRGIAVNDTVMRLKGDALKRQAA